MQVGVCYAIDPENLQDIKVSVKDEGADFIEGHCYNLAILEQTQFDRVIAYTRDIGLPLNCLYSFLGKMDVFDTPELYKAAQEYVKRTFARFADTDVKHIAFGGGKSRASNANRSIAETKKMFAEFCAETVAPLARDYGYTVGIEPLNSGETDTYTTAVETYELIRELDLPQIKMNLDYFHFNKENENVSDLHNYASSISHLHIASIERFFPRPEHNESENYLRFLTAVLPHVDPETTLSIEGRLSKPIGISFGYLRALLKEAKERVSHG